MRDGKWKQYLVLNVIIKLWVLIFIFGIKSSNIGKLCTNINHC